MFFVITTFSAAKLHKKQKKPSKNNYFSQKIIQKQKILWKNVRCFANILYFCTRNQLIGA